jgi:hypothetical protein
LKWLVDIHEICMSRVLDWRNLREKAERFELDAIVGQTLTVCSSLLSTPTLAGFSAALLPSKMHLFPATPDIPGAGKIPFFHLRVLKRPLDKLRCLAAILLVPKLTDRQFLRLPPSLGFFYYILRPWRLAFKWTWRSVRASLRRVARIRSQKNDGQQDASLSPLQGETEQKART